MFARLFGSKKKADERPVESSSGTVASDFSFLQSDMHSHFVPGVDDGAATLEDSISLIQAMQAMGYQRIVTTPHINYDHYPNTPEKLAKAYAELQQGLKEHNITIPVRFAAEYFIDNYFIQLLEEKAELLTVVYKQVLVEFSFASQPMNLNDILFKIQTNGYRPIIAHPERYIFFHNTKSTAYQDLKDRGCLLQLNILSLLGYYGNDVKIVAEYLMEKGLYDYCGTDMHHIKHAETMQRLYQSKWFGKLQKYPFLNARMPVEPNVL